MDWEKRFYNTLVRFYAEAGWDKAIRKLKRRGLIRHTFRVDGAVVPGCRDCDEILDAAGMDWTGKRVLDIGASMGGFAFAIHFRGAREVVAIEPSPVMVRFAEWIKKEVYKIDSPSPRFVCTDLQHFRRQRPEPFDVVLALALHKQVSLKVLCSFVDRFCRETFLFQTHGIDAAGRDMAVGMTPDQLVELIAAWTGLQPVRQVPTWEYTERGGPKSKKRVLMVFTSGPGRTTRWNRWRRAWTRFLQPAPTRKPAA